MTMRVVTNVSEMQNEAFALKRKGICVGIVPTMGCLHEGHLSLVRTAGELCDITIVTIFVNPTQFGPNEDFSRYPRNFEQDCLMCAGEKVDFVFHPAVSDIYHKDHDVYVVDEHLGAGLCGLSRPGHFRGVLTIVAKLFNLTLPDVAVFGQKDAQQAVLVRRMAGDLNFPVKIVVNPIVRESDGLAISSRNKYLSDCERKEASCLFQALEKAAEACRDGVRDANELKNITRTIIENGSSAQIEYVEAVDYATLQPVTAVENDVLLAIAARFGKTRLIDNTILS